MDEDFKRSRFNCSYLSRLGRNKRNLDRLRAARQNKDFTTNFFDWVVSRLWCLDSIYNLEDLENG